MTESAPGHFDANIDPGWTIAGRPNGGYLLALLGRAAERTGPHEHVVAASAQFLSPPEPGPVTIEVEVLRAGRSASQLRARMIQHDAGCVEALLTTGTLGTAEEPHWSGGVPSTPDTCFEDARRVPGVNPAGTPVPIMDQVDLRLDPASTGFAVGRPSGSGELWGWLDIPGTEPIDPAALLYAVDAFPPATFEIELTGWVPTLALTVYVRALPAPGPLRVLQRANLVAAQRVDETCWVWDSHGRVVAHGAQLAAIRLGEPPRG
ncbi:MAG: thioesterase family protein [Jatrophihabitans sp.]